MGKVHGAIFFLIFLSPGTDIKANVDTSVSSLTLNYPDHDGQHFFDKESRFHLFDGLPLGGIGDGRNKKNRREIVGRNLRAAAAEPISSLLSRLLHRPRRRKSSPAPAGAEKDIQLFVRHLRPALQRGQRRRRLRLLQRTSARRRATRAAQAAQAVEAGSGDKSSAPKCPD